jgi:hypothetical protein
MGVALVGFVGVLIGAVVSVAGKWLVTIRDELNEAMVAARLVDADLAAMESGGDHDVPSHLASWQSNRAALAKVLGYRQWQAVSNVYGAGNAPMLEEDTLRRARNSLAPFAVSKRTAVRQRVRNVGRRHSLQ